MADKTITLIKANLRDAYGGRTATGYATAALLAILIVPSVLIGVGVNFWMMAELLDISPKIILSLGFFSAVAVTLFTGIWKAGSFLFHFRDFELLMSMPVEPGQIFLSKMFRFYLTSMVYGGIVLFPALAVIGIREGIGVFGWLFGIMLALLAPVIPMIFGALVSLATMGISLKFRKNSLVAAVLTMLVILLMVVGIQLMERMQATDLAAAIEQLNRYLAIYPISGWFAAAVVDGDAVQFALAALCSLLALALFVSAFAKSFRRINSMSGETHSGSNYKMSRLEVSSPIIALCKKELSFYFSSYVYVVNTLVGLLMAMGYLGATIFFGLDKMAQVLEFPELSGFALPVAAIVSAFGVVTCCPAASSISLEGGRIWIVKSLPVSFRQIAASKILANLMVIFPFIVLGTLLSAIGLRPAVPELLAYIAVMLACAVLTSVIGLVTNLIFPRLDWKTHTQVVKQSVSVLVSMLANMLTVLLLAVGYMALELPFAVYAAIASAVLLALGAGIWTFICAAGGEMFGKLY